MTFYTCHVGTPPRQTTWVATFGTVPRAGASVFRDSAREHRSAVRPRASRSVEAQASDPDNSARLRPPSVPLAPPPFSLSVRVRFSSAFRAPSVGDHRVLGPALRCSPALRAGFIPHWSPDLEPVWYATLPSAV